MATQRSSQQSKARSSKPDTATSDQPKKNVTPPKGRPTRPRNASGYEKRAFGPMAQWITVGVVIALIVVVLVLVTDGGDFNPFDEDQPLPSEFGTPAAIVPTAA